MGLTDFYKMAVVIFAALFLSFGIVGERVEADSYLRAGSPVIIVNNEKMVMDVLPQIQNGRVMVPLRGVFEKMGAVVSWNSETQSITLINGTNIINLRIKSLIATINNKEEKLDTAPFIINGRTMVPLRFVSENLNAKVNWIAATKTVEIVTLNKETPEPSVSQIDDQGQLTSNNDSLPNSNSEIKSNTGNEENPGNETRKTIVELITDQKEVKVGQTFEVQVIVRDIVDLYTLEVQLAYSPRELKAKSIKGDFLKGTDIKKEADKDKGIIDYVSTKLGQVPGKNGDGILAIVLFEALEKGLTEISLTGDGVQMVNTFGRLIDYLGKDTVIEINIKE